MKKLLQTILVCLLSVFVVGCSEVETPVVTDTPVVTNTPNERETLPVITDAPEVNVETVEEEVPIEKILSEVPDPEIGRAFTLGLVPKEMMCDYDTVATEKELVKLIGNAVEKMDSSKLTEWQELSSAATNAETIRQEAAIALYIAAGLFDEIPMANADCDERVDWSRWMEDGTQVDWSRGVSLSTIFQEYGYNTDYKLYNQYKDYFEGDYSLGINYTFLTGSRHSQNLIFDQDEEGQGMNFIDPLTRGDLILAVVRWYDSYDEPAEYVAPTDEKAFECTITEEQIANAADVPTCSAQEFPQYVGVGDFTKSSYLGTSGGNKVQEYCEGDIKHLAENGYNYLRVMLSFSTLSAPDFPQDDEAYINLRELEDIDELVGWGMKHGVHITVTMASPPGRYMDGSWSWEAWNLEAAADTAETPFTEEDWKNITDCFHMLAKRYANVPADYLSFELGNEMVGYDVKMQMSHWKPIIDDIRTVTPDRVLMMSTDNHEEIDFVTAFAKEGVVISYHSYNPRGFVYFQNGGSEDTSVPAPTWPYTDENGVTWNAELIYESYIKPIHEIALENNVGFIVGEVGLCNSPRANLISQEDALEYGKEMVAMFKNHGIAYSHFNYMSDMGFARQYNPNLPSREGEVMTPVTYTFDDYEYRFYVDQELMDVWAGKE
ncbi:MAG: cellulase family glycosylhydrolase [Lachnospiraceae bacterium]|nr:cellulase family glycosylhydrolase [Lachnospiraceae bacterium]